MDNRVLRNKLVPRDSAASRSQPSSPPLTDPTAAASRLGLSPLRSQRKSLATEPSVNHPNPRKTPSSVADGLLRCQRSPSIHSGIICAMRRGSAAAAAMINRHPPLHPDLSPSPACAAARSNDLSSQNLTATIRSTLGVHASVVMICHLKINKNGLSSLSTGAKYSPAAFGACPSNYQGKSTNRGVSRDAGNGFISADSRGELKVPSDSIEINAATEEHFS